MAGEAKTNSFLIGAATVMIGPMADVYKLTPADNSIGLVKNFQVTAEPNYTELTQGIQNTIVYSVLTANPVRCSMEVYEFNGKNLAYGLGLDGSSYVEQTAKTLKTAITAGGTSVVADAASNPNWATGDYIILQEDKGDKIHVGILASNGTFNTDQVTLTFTANTAIPTGMTFAASRTRVARVNKIEVGSKDAQPFLSAKVVGILPEDNKPITILFPKLRITKGFTLSFGSEGFGNLPFEFTPYEMVSADTLYSDFKGSVAKLLTMF